MVTRANRCNNNLVSKRLKREALRYFCDIFTRRGYERRVGINADIFYGQLT